MLSSHLIPYGLTRLGSTKLMFCPRNVAAPFDEPEGCRNPFGNGSESVDRTGGSSGEGSGIGVCWLKPNWFGLGSGYTGSTNTPKPPRITVLLPQIGGVQAKPTRGLKIFELVL